MNSATLYNLCTLGYLLALVLFSVFIVWPNAKLKRSGIVIMALSFLLQTSGMTLRWIEAGLVEVMATQRTLGHSLSGWSWFVVFSQHPPWSNLYEIMVYMSWGIILVVLIAEIKWPLHWIRMSGVFLALMALGMASLTDGTIKPLVPALKSWWIMIHVISASVAYAAGSLGAAVCFCQLLKDEKRVSRVHLAMGVLLLSFALIFCVGGGDRLFREQAYFVKLISEASGQKMFVTDLSKSNSPSFLWPSPNAGWAMIITLAAHLISLALLFFRRAQLNNKTTALLFLMPVVMTLGTILLLLGNDLLWNAVSIPMPLAHHLMPQGPYVLGLRSHPWGLFLLFLVLAIQILCLLVLYYPQVTQKMPSSERLDHAAYRSLTLSFFLMTIVLITGALWAHYAWGRYWAWDPKETGALAIWINYAIYLHTRRTAGFSGPWTSVIGVFGFFVIIIGFLGVNLGLFANGLHSYGSA